MISSTKLTDEKIKIPERISNCEGMGRDTRKLRCGNKWLYSNLLIQCQHFVRVHSLSMILLSVKGQYLSNLSVTAGKQTDGQFLRAYFHRVRSSFKNKL